jgi:type IV pilus assembly protein PilY1
MTSLRPLTILGLATLTFSSGLSAQAATVPIAQSPLFVAAQVPPLNMLVMGKDHKIYYEAYNDASDLNGDGILDVGYKPAQIDYFGYFNSNACYLWNAGANRFEAAAAATNKQCGGAGQWSGDFLNYLTTSRMDALRRVLYGGWRQQDTATDTTLQGAFFPQDAHSWGKEYRSIARDGYDISRYAPLTAPAAGTYHLFAVTTLRGNNAVYPAYEAPVLRVLQNTTSRVWNWLSIEGPVAGNSCFTASNSRVSCLDTGATAGGWALVPQTALADVQITTWRHSGGHPNNSAEMDAFFTTWATTANRCGTGPVASGLINVADEGNNNPFTGASNNNCTHENYLTEITASLTVTEAGDYRFAVDGDDAVDVAVNGTVVAGWYGGHGRDRSASGLDSHSGTINLPVGTHTIRFRHEEVFGGDNWGLFWQPPDAGGGGSVSRQDYAVRVQACPGNAALRSSDCSRYPSGAYKPTGILHDYGESERMMFGLITGSQINNLEGGVLRRNVLNFKDEIDPNTGQFRTTVRGIVDSIDRLRMIGGGYNSSVTDNSAGDTNWNWANGTGDCPSIGGRPINNRECRMWGNPLGEMLYESMRYFAGAAEPTPRFATPGGAADPGAVEEGDTRMGLPADRWRDPYLSSTSGGLGYLSCAKPYQTIISDINPSYDGDLPGTPFGDAIDDQLGPTPASISAFNAADQGQIIWNHEFGAGARSVFIGEVAGGSNDDAPTAKSAGSLGNIRGLAPEEPGKLGTYNTANVARFARVTDVNAAPGMQNVSTFAVALASPLPRIEFPVGGRTVTLIPFAKTVSGTFGGATRKPTNTIVDFYVENIVNLPGAPTVVSVNGGRPYAVFRINYEDVEQGNDHDMDAIVRYEVLANADSTVTVRLDSEYAAGSADQNMGYIISGTTADGVYLEVRDVGGPGTPWDLNTPPGATAGQCALAGALSTPPCNQALPLTAERTFTPSAAAATALNLKDPLWFAAKYGGFRESSGGNNLPDGTEWDSDGDGTPDNYFLVTNPLELREQLGNAFDSILEDDKPAGGLANTGSRIGLGSQEFVPRYSVDANERDWTGDLQAFEIRLDGTRGPQQWSAKDRLAAQSPSGRRIFTTNQTGPAATHTATSFLAASFGASRADQVGAIGLTPGQVDARFGTTTTGEDLYNYLRGDKTKEQSEPGGVFRNRSALIGSIINSEPEVSLKSDVFRWISVPALRAEYQDYVTAKRANASRPNLIMVGSNNGYLHAFNTVTGNEVFAYLPASARVQLGEVAEPTFTHRYLMDGDITAVDARLGGNWATVVLGATGRGGKSIFALDITNPQSFSDSSVLWELEGGTGSGKDADIGHVVGRSQVMYGEDGNWYAVFGNGVNSINSNPVLMIVNLQTGVVVGRLVANDGGNFTNGLINVAMVDADGNGRIDAAYGGDLQGNLWKFDLSATSASSWNVAFSGNPMFTAASPDGVRQPITGGIDVARGAGGLMVFFGTGRYLASEDREAGTNPQVQSLYGVRDNGVQNSGTRANLQRQEISSGTNDPNVRDTRITTNNPVNFTSQRGWYLDLIVNSTARGERFTGDPEVRGGVVFLPTFETTGDSCVPGAQNWVYGLDAITGSSALGGTASVGGGTVCGTSCGAVEASEGAPIRSAVFTQQAAVCRPGIDPGCSSNVPTPESIAAACGALTGAAYQACVAGLTSGPSGPSASGAQTRCGEVERQTGAVFERACGRQSWRQVR